MRVFVCLLIVACGSGNPPGVGDADTGDGAKHDAPGTGIDGAPLGPNGCRARDCGGDGSGGDCGDCGNTFQCDTNLGLCIPDNGQDVGITFQGGCWYLCPADSTYCTPGVRYQAMNFELAAAYPVEATLYFDHDCDPADGTDNLNDTGAATPTQIGIEWFIHHPDERPSSAVWWAGHHSSGCFDYSSAADCQ